MIYETKREYQDEAITLTLEATAGAHKINLMFGVASKISSAKTHVLIILETDDFLAELSEPSLSAFVDRHKEALKGQALKLLPENWHTSKWSEKTMERDQQMTNYPVNCICHCNFNGEEMRLATSGNSKAHALKLLHQGIKDNHRDNETYFFVPHSIEKVVVRRGRYRNSSKQAG